MSSFFNSPKPKDAALYDKGEQIILTLIENN